MKNQAALTFVSLLAFALAASAQTAQPLGTTAPYGIVSSTFTNSNTAPQTIINGDVCFTTGPVTPPLSITGATVTPCPPAVGIDQGLALADLNGQPCTFLGAGAITLDSIVIGANPPGTIPPGCYSSGGAMNITATTNVTLSGAGIYIFRPGGALNTWSELPRAHGKRRLFQQRVLGARRRRDDRRECRPVADADLRRHHHRRRGHHDRPFRQPGGPGAGLQRGRHGGCQ